MTARGRVTLPPEICDVLGVGPGDLLAYEIDGDQVILSKGNVSNDESEAFSDADVQSAIDAALADPRPSVSIDEAFAKVRARIDARARRMDAA